MKKIISFSLYGENAKYCIGAVRNALLQKTVYPGWTCRFYHDSTVPSIYINQLKANGAELIDMTDTELHGYGMYWRFLAYDDKETERFIVRDTDSRLNYREKSAVDQWIASAKSLHVMRDHPFHNVEILGGTWGLVNDGSFNMLALIREHLKSYTEFRYSDDQVFLKKIYSQYADSIICHDEFFNYAFNRPFPEIRKDLEFVGEVFDENDIPIEEHRKILFAKLKEKNRQAFFIKLKKLFQGK